MLTKTDRLTKSAFAREVGLTAGRVSQMVKQGLPVEADGTIDLERGKAWIQINVDQRRSFPASERQAKPATASERDRLVREQADHVALKNAALRKELVPAVEVKARWQDILRRIRSGVLSVPSRCRQQAPHFSTRDVALIDAELRRILDELAGGADA